MFSTRAKSLSVPILSTLLLLSACSHGAGVSPKDGNPLNKLDRKGFTALHRAAQRGDTATVRELLDAGADPNIRANTALRELPINMAAGADRVNVEVLSMLVNSGTDIDASLTNGVTPLFAALYRKENSAAARFLIDHGANVDIRTDQGWTPLHRAISTGNNEIVALILEHGADPDVMTRRDDTPLYLAVKNRNSEGVALLLDHHADPDLPHYLAKRPLIKALKMGQWDLANQILSFQATMPDLTRLFEIIISSGDLTLVRSVLANGYDPQTTNQDGLTPLHLAAINGNVKIIKLFLDAGIDVESMDRYGHTPLYYAVLNRHPDAAAYLFSVGANVVEVCASGNDGETTAWSYMSRGQAYSQEGRNVEAVEAYRAARDWFDEAGRIYDEERQDLGTALTSAKVGNAVKIAGSIAVYALAAAALQHEAQQQSKDHAQASALHYSQSTGTGQMGYVRYMNRYNSAPHAPVVSNGLTGGFAESISIFALTNTQSIDVAIRERDASARRMSEQAAKVEGALECAASQTDGATRCMAALWPNAK